MSFRERNNAASKKSYEKSMEQTYATAYEHAVVMKHATDHPTSQVAHWSRVPEEWLEEAGYITSYNEHRLKRLMAKQEPVDGVNRLKDYGADAMTRSSDGTYDLLQAKYYKSNRVTAADIGTFAVSLLSLQLRHPTSKGHLYTSSRLQADLAGFMAHPQYPIRHVHFPWAPPDKRLEPKKHVILQDADLPLRDYQERALHELHEQDGINALHIPCRMGKTIIAGHVIRSKQPRILVVMAPLKISVQNLRDSHRLASFLPAYKSILVDSDAEGTTDRNEILAFLKTDGPHVIYTTYESAVTVVATIPGIEEAYLLADEVHNVTPVECEFIKRFSQGLVMSATLPEELEEELLLNTIVRVPFAQGIRDGYLTDYSIWLPFLTRNQAGETSVAVDIPDTFQQDDQTTIAQAMYLATVMLKTGARRCIVYLTRQEDCQRFMEHTSKVFEEYHGITIWTNKIDGTVSAAERTKRLQDFQSDLDAPFYLLTSVRILDEAVDIPKCDSVFVTSVGERSSDIRMMQRAMRGSTVDPSNPSKHNQIILWANGWERCVGSLELIREADPGFHKKIRVATTYDRQGTTRETKNAVIQQEQETREYMVVSCISPWERQKMRWIAVYERLGRTPSQTSKETDEKRAGQWQNNQRIAKKKGTLSTERSVELEAIPGWEWDSDTWEEQRNHWITQYEKLQRAPSTISKETEEKRAGQWQSNQRTAKKKGTLSTERSAELEAIPGWEWDIWEEQRNNWITQYEKLQRTPSQTSKETDEKRAGRWQSRQRTAQKKGTLSTERSAELEAIPGWEWEADAYTWEEQRNHWITQYEKLQRAPSTKSKETDEKRAGHWQSNMRRVKKNGTMTTERSAELEAIPGWEWGTERDETYTWEEQKQNWITQYEKLQRTPSQTSKDTEECRAGKWQNNTRMVYKKRKMSQECIAQMEAIPGWEWGMEREETYTWEEQLQHWKTVYTRIQKAPPQSSKDKEERRAGQWQSNMRAAKKKMSAERITALEAIPGWEWGTERDETYTWEEQKINWITQYIKIQMSPSTISKNLEEKRAGRWQSNLRQYYKKGSLSQERIAELNAIDGWTWSVK
jgi:superfamily II DNA or RNA helicase